MQKYSDIIEEEKERESELEKQVKFNKLRPVVVKKDESYLNLPESDFRDIDVIPGEQQLRERVTKISPMPAEGDLQNCHNYLDLLFRLLHEDGI